MKVFKNLKELATAPVEMLEEHKNIVFEEDLGGEFMMIFGGDWHLIETKEDLENIAEGPYDIVEWKNELLMLVTINNNSGGPAYFIPRDIVAGSSFEALETTN
jgi:hypothetical protein